MRPGAPHRHGEREQVSARSQFQVVVRQVGPGAGGKAPAEIGVAYPADEGGGGGRFAAQQGLDVVGAGDVLVAVAVDPFAGDDEADFLGARGTDRRRRRLRADEAGGIEMARLAEALQALDAGRRAEHDVFPCQVGLHQPGG